MEYVDGLVIGWIVGVLSGLVISVIVMLNT